MRHSLYFIASFLLILTTACGPFKYKPVDAKEFPPDPKERVKKNIEEGRGFRIMGSLDKGGKFEFASSNPLWRATLDTLDFMPLVSANYSGGIVITDWYTENNTPAESVKITVRFLTNEIRSDALNVTIYKKKCININSCQTSKIESNLNNEIKTSILKRAAILKKEADSKKDE